jgi:methylated-DNA-[protein]-cysteine S-methyltransferase
MNKEMVVYWTLFTWNDWSLYMAATSKGLCFIGSNHGDLNELKQWTDKTMPHGRLVRDDEKL